MADQKISSLTAATSLGDADLLTSVQGGSNKSVTGLVLKTDIGWGRSGTDVTPKTSGDNVNIGTGGLKDNDVVVAVSLGDALNVSLDTVNKTILGSINELKLFDDNAFLDGTFSVKNTVDPTKQLAFSVTGITTLNTRTITWPDRDLTIDNLTTSSTTNLTGLLRGDGSNVSASSSINLATEVSGLLSLANGGSGIDSSGSIDGQLLIGGTASNDLQLATISGTADQITVTNATNSITLSLPQSINTTSNVTFDQITGTLQTPAQANITSVGTLTALDVDNVNINGNTISSSSGDLNINPSSGNDVVIDSAWEFDGSTLTMIGGLDATITAVVGRSINIELTEFDGGIIRGGTLGDASLPTFQFLGDSNTGMYSSGAETIDFATAGGSRFRIDSTGSVSIGQNLSPLAKLHIDQSSSTGAIPVLILDQADVDQPTVKIIATESANATDTISTLGTPGTIAKWEQVDVNGTKYWRPLYTDPS